MAFLGLFGLFGVLPVSAFATQPLTYRYEHYLFTINPNTSPEWKSSHEVWTYHGQPIEPPSSLLVDGDVLPNLPEGMERHSEKSWNLDAIRATIADVIGRPLSRSAGAVTIARDGSGAVTFDGVGLTGRTVDIAAAARLTVEALDRGVFEIWLPVLETQPQITVSDPSLAAAGIKEVVTIGESDFSNSPANRLHNIAVGLSKFNGHLVARGEIFSFDQVLRRVDETTGYLKELVIKGDRTVPDYGGGLCQVSTTAYRGIWEYGLPILQRKNHSYTVRHYFPEGTDATVYPPNVDMRFKNDTPGALLLQTYEQGTNAYFIYYGTRDDRQTEIIGPYTWDPQPPPPDKTQPTIEIPIGTTKKVGDRVPGLKALWYRFVHRAGAPEQQESVYSFYEARPLFTLVGVEHMPGSGDVLAAPGATLP
ncbi:VanW family protein [Candidatus Peregrinibacteria bacterium]|nr:VanW family protein [Candidatus Peregrinibacteria bacterium]